MYVKVTFGGFLIESLRYVWSQIQNEGQELGWPEREIFADQQEVAIKNFRGIDKESLISEMKQKNLCGMFY